MTQFPFLLSLFATVLICNSCSSRGPREDKQAPADVPGEVVIPVSEQAGLIESEVAEVRHEPDVIRVPGLVALADNGKWRVGAITSGRIERVLVSQGDYVHSGQILARMHSHDVHEAKAAYLMAIAEKARSESAEAIAQKNSERTQRLFDLKAASLEQVEFAKQQVVDAQTAVRNSDIAVERERVHLEDNLGISLNDLISDSSGDPDLIPIRAPASGYILQKNITPGTVVDLAADLFVIGELEHLWLTASVRQEYLGTLRKGQPVVISVNGLPDIHVNGRITNVGEQFDSTTHTMQIRVEFENPRNLLRPEMLATAQIAAGMEKAALSVPADAVQQVDGQDSVFVRTAPDRFVMRPVMTGSQMGGRVSIEDGLNLGEQVVTRGAFIVKSELLKSSIQSD
jgi:multidrug efflux pump subunit AcrA (membrane-fusion protein)